MLNDNTLDLSKIEDVFSLCNDLLLKFIEFIKRNIVHVFTIIYYFNNSEMQISLQLVEILAWVPKTSHIFSILIPVMEKQISR